MLLRGRRLCGCECIVIMYVALRAMRTDVGGLGEIGA
jgi:hypothetical protein